MPKEIIIKDEVILPGEVKHLNFSMARLPTGTRIDLPIIVGRSKVDGPVLLIMGGMHGDEINGVEIVRRFIKNKFHIPEKGSVICIPVLNIFGFINFSREDGGGKDVNRSFPGSSRGSLASQIAHFVSTSVLPNVDLGVDFHTGGKRINNFPQIRCQLDSLRNKEFAEAFAPPIIINSPYRDKSLRKHSAQLEKEILVFEGGESLRLRLNAIEHGIKGTLRLMHHLGMISSSTPPKQETVTLMKSSWIRAGRAGMQHLTVRNGNSVEKNEILGYISDPYAQTEYPVKAPHEGYVIAINNNPIVNRGDALIHLGVL